LVLARLREFRAGGLAVPHVLADQWMPTLMGTEFLAQVRNVLSTARRGLLISWSGCRNRRWRNCTAPRG